MIVHCPTAAGGGADSVRGAPDLPVLDLTDFKRDLSELTDRLGHAQDCL